MKRKGKKITTKTIKKSEAAFTWVFEKFWQEMAKKYPYANKTLIVEQAIRISNRRRKGVSPKIVEKLFKFHDEVTRHHIEW